MIHKRQRLVEWSDPAVIAAKSQGLSGMQVLEGICDGSIPPPPFATLLGVRLVEVSDGCAVFEATPREEHYNPAGVVHGGFAMSLLDSALGCAINSKLPAGSAYATIDVHVRLMRPIIIETGTVRCEARVATMTKSLATAEGEILDGAGRVLATGTTACMIFDESLKRVRQK
jgi:uncharacterized protein (TIGR00369 family)